MTHMHLKSQVIFQSIYFHFVEFCSYKVLIEFILFANGALRIYNTCLFYCFSLFSISFKKIAVLIFVLLIQFSLEAIGFSLSTGFYILIIVFFIWKLPLWILHCFSHMNIIFPMTFTLIFFFNFGKVYYTLATCWKELTHWKRSWCWERLRAGGEGGNRVWDDWMASRMDSMEMGLNKLQEMLKDKETWCAIVNGVTKNWRGLSNWTELNTKLYRFNHFKKYRLVLLNIFGM